MAVIYNGPTKFEMFKQKIWALPFLRIAVFAAIVAIVLLAFKGISRIFWYIAIMAIVARIFAALLLQTHHRLAVISMTSFGIWAESSIVFKLLLSYSFEEMANTVGRIGTAFLWIFGAIAVLALVLTAVTFLVRVFIALFL